MQPQSSSKNTFAFLALLAALLLGGPVATRAQISRTFSFQGLLTDSTGAPLPDGTYSMIFRIYPAAMGGSQVWSSGRSVTTTDGYFSIVLGDHVSLDGVDFADSLWLAEQVVGDDEMTPRTPLTSVPSAIGLVHPYKAVVNTGPPSFWVENQGLGTPARFVTNNPSSGQPTLHVMTNGSGPAVLVENSYTWLKDGYLYIGPGHEIVSFNSTLATPHLLLREESAGDGGGDFARLRMHNQDNGEYWDIAAGGAGNDRLNFFRFGTGDIMTLRSSGRVGIGTSNPDSMLQVAGSIKADGTILSGGDVVANEFKYVGVRGATYQRPVSAFTMDLHSQDNSTSTSDSEDWIRQDGYIQMTENLALVAPRVFSAPVDLPQGAEVLTLALFYYDNSAPYWVQGEYSLKRRNLLATGVDIVASEPVVSDGTSTAVRLDVTTSIDPTYKTIDNLNYQYWVEFYWERGGGTNDVTDPGIRFYGMSIGYVVATVAP